MTPEPQFAATRMLTESVYPWAGRVNTHISQYLFATDRSRTECLDPLATGFQIERRDLRQTFRIFAVQKNYQVIPLFDLATDQEKADFQDLGKYWRNWRRSTRRLTDATRELKITVGYELTGEEKEMFGCLARHWIIRRRDEHDKNFGENWTEATTDAWYLDDEQMSTRFAGFSCDLVHHGLCYLTAGDERAIINHLGKRPTGVCAASDTRSLHHTTLPNDEIREHMDHTSTRAISISDVNVPAQLFEPPLGFRKISAFPGRLALTKLHVTRDIRHLLRTSR